MKDKCLCALLSGWLLDNLKVSALIKDSHSINLSGVFCLTGRPTFWGERRACFQKLRFGEFGCLVERCYELRLPSPYWASSVALVSLKRKKKKKSLKLFPNQTPSEMIIIVKTQQRARRRGYVRVRNVYSDDGPVMAAVCVRVAIAAESGPLLVRC